MRSIASLAILTALTLTCACQREVQPPAAPGTLSLADYQGRWLIINYWAQWCAPCRTEIPELNQLARHDPTRIAVVGVNYDGLGAEALDRAAAALAIAFSNVVQDPSAALGYPRPRVLPTTYIFDPESQLAHQLAGPQTLNQLLVLIDRDEVGAAKADAR